MLVQLFITVIGVINPSSIRQSFPHYLHDSALLTKPARLLARGEGKLYGVCVPRAIWPRARIQVISTSVVPSWNVTTIEIAAYGEQFIAHGSQAELISAHGPNRADAPRIGGHIEASR